jgi:hypothetical protein
MMTYLSTVHIIMTYFSQSFIKYIALQIEQNTHSCFKCSLLFLSFSPAVIGVIYAVVGTLPEFAIYVTAKLLN